MTETEKTPPGQIHTAIIEIMRAVEPIAKSLRNEQQKFNYRGIDQVYNAVHPLFAQHGVYSTSTILEMRHNEQPSKAGGVNRFAVLKMRYTFRAADGSEVFTEVVGEGMDSGDKANNKAMSAANKYALLQILMIPTAMVDGDAPEPRDNPARDESAPRTATRSERAKTSQREQQVTAIKKGWRDMAEAVAVITAETPPDELRSAFALWVMQVAGRQFNPNQLAEWTEADLTACNEALKQ